MPSILMKLMSSSVVAVATARHRLTSSSETLTGPDRLPDSSIPQACVRLCVNFKLEIRH